MKESSTDHWRCNSRPDRPWQGGALASSLLLAQFSTRVPPHLLERLRIAPQLGLRQGEIAATAIDRFLTESAF